MHLRPGAEAGRRGTRQVTYRKVRILQGHVHRVRHRRARVRCPDRMPFAPGLRRVLARLPADRSKLRRILARLPADRNKRRVGTDRLQRLPV
jgi:hypothetical protein